MRATIAPRSVCLDHRGRCLCNDRVYSRSDTDEKGASLRSRRVTESFGDDGFRASDMPLTGGYDGYNNRAKLLSIPTKLSRPY